MITRIVLDVHTDEPITPVSLYENVVTILTSSAKFDDCRIDGGCAYEIPKLTDMVCPKCEGPKDVCDCLPELAGLDAFIENQRQAKS